MTGLLWDVLRMTAWEWEAPRPWGRFHTLFFCIGIPLAVLLALGAARLGERALRRVIFAVGVVLAVSEIYKQLFFVAAEGAYRFDQIPFQLCSVPMYLCLILPWIDGRERFAAVSRAMWGFLASYGLMGGVASYLSPETMCRPYVTLTVHSFVWHLCLIFLGVTAAAAGRTGRKMKDFGGVAAIYGICCCVAFAINLLCFNAPGRDVNMFYLGPKPSYLVVCRDIVARFGWYVNLPVYTAALTLGAGIIFFAVTVLPARIRRQRRERGTGK